MPAAFSRVKRVLNPFYRQHGEADLEHARGLQQSKTGFKPVLQATRGSRENMPACFALHPHVFKPEAV